MSLCPGTGTVAYWLPNKLDWTRVFGSVPPLTSTNPDTFVRTRRSPGGPPRTRRCRSGPRKPSPDPLDRGFDLAHPHFWTRAALTSGQGQPSPERAKVWQCTCQARRPQTPRLQRRCKASKESSCFSFLHSHRSISCRTRARLIARSPGAGAPAYTDGARQYLNSGFASQPYITGPIRHGTNSLCPSRSAQVRRPPATSTIRSKIRRPTSRTVDSPSATSPALTSMLSFMRA